MDSITRFRGRWQSLSLMLRRRLLRLIAAAPSDQGHRRFALLGHDAVSEEIMVAGLYEAALLLPLFDRLLAARREAFANGVAVDVGANIGNHSLFFARRFAAVIAVEPNPVALALLRCNVELANAAVTIAPVGIGDRDGSFAFASNADGNLGGSGFRFAGVAGGDAIECPLRRGDDLLPALLAGRPLALIKLDVEGAELAALSGLGQTIAAHRPVILFESNRAERGEAVIEHLRQQGYKDFWSVEEIGQGGRPLAKLLRRLAFGETIAIRPLTRLEDRPYAMLVATFEPGTEAAG